MPEFLPPTHNDPTKQEVTNLYAALGVGLVLSLVPHSIVTLVSLVFMLGVLGSAYSKRKKAAPDSLLENHATYIIRTIWIGTLFSVITISLAGLYMMNDIDYSAFQPCAKEFGRKGASFAANASFHDIWIASEPCYNNFINENFSLLTHSAIIAAGPVIIYFGYRYAKGLTRAMKGYRIMNPTGWF